MTSTSSEPGRECSVSGSNDAGAKDESGSLSHLDASGAAHMVDVSGKAQTAREAVASAVVALSAEAMQALRDGNNKKGDVLATARIAGIQAAKRCSDLIPLCHPLMIHSVAVDVDLRNDNRVVIVARCKTEGQTGIEMEAMTAASIAALTVYDMCKAVDKRIIIETVQLDQKTGGKSGDWQR